MTKKILFDLSVCQPIEHIKFHGGGVYGYIVFKQLCFDAPEKVVAYWDYTRFIEPSIKELISQKKILSIDAHKKSIIESIDENIAAIYSPLYKDEYKQLFSLEIPIYITVHGLRKLEMNRDKYEIKYATNLKTFIKCLLKRTPLYRLLWSKFYREYELLLKQSNVNIVTVSNHSKNSILYYYPSFETSKIKVFYSPSTTVELKKFVPVGLSKYYLIVSGDRWLKNAIRAMESFDKLFSKGKCADCKVVVVGISPKQNVTKWICNKDQFVIKDYVNKQELESLLKSAYALVYPSLNEGFGYPPLEAMKYGTPVIASPFASIPEICADAVVYANPYSVDEIAMRIMYLNDDSVYQDYRNRARSRYDYIVKKQNEDLKKMIVFLLEKLE